MAQWPVGSKHELLGNVFIKTKLIGIFAWENKLSQTKHNNCNLLHLLRFCKFKWFPTVFIACTRLCTIYCYLIILTQKHINFTWINICHLYCKLNGLYWLNGSHLIFLTRAFLCSALFLLRVRCFVNDSTTALVN